MIETTLHLPPRYVFCAICTIPVWIFVLSNSSSPNYDSAGARYTTASLPPVMFDAPLEQAEPDRESKADRLGAPRKNDAQRSAPARADEQPSGEGADVSIAGGEPHADVVRQYLWDVYERASAKLDSHGDFTWKDEAAAARLGLSTEEYVVGGMDPDFREQLFAAGRAMDAAGINWTLLSAFRDDYRQDLAVGFKAQTGNSFHGGSVATGGYGHGCAVDIASTDGLSNAAVWNWLDQHGEQFGLRRPLRQIDPAHIQTSAGWHDLAVTLRDERTRTDPDPTMTAAAADEPGEPVSPPTTKDSSERSSSVGLSPEQYNCVRPRPPEESLRTAAIVGRMRAFITILPTAGAEKNRAKNQERTAAERTTGEHSTGERATGGGPRRANARHQDNSSRHAKLKAGFHLAG